MKPFDLPEAHRLRNERILAARAITPQKPVSKAMAYEQYDRIKLQSNRAKAKSTEIPENEGKLEDG